MIFGEIKKFAIECVVINPLKSKKITFGHITIWIESEQLGDFSAIVILETPVRYFFDSLQYCGKRKNNLLSNMNSLEIFNFLDSILWGENNDEDEIHFLSQTLNQESINYEKFNICTNFSEAFDGEQIFLIEEDENERFIWKTFGSQLIKETRLKTGTYIMVVKSFTNWFFNTTGFEIR